jgi:hypothetical protein
MNLVGVFLQSKELKRTIVSLSVKHNIPLKYIAKDINMEYDYFMRAYINSMINDKFDIKLWQVERIFYILGIEARTQFVINGKHDFEKVQKLLKDKHGYARWSNKEEGFGTDAQGFDSILD